MPNQPIIWTLKTDNDVSLEYGIGFCGIGMTGASATQMTLECEFDHLRQPHKEKATGDVQTQGDPFIGKLDAGDGHARTGKGGAKVDYVHMYRNIKTDLPELDVCDGSSTGQPENSCFIDAQVTAPTIIECRIDLPLPGIGEQPAQTMNLPMPVKFDFPYDPWAKEPLEGDIDLDKFINESLKTAPFPGEIKDAKGAAHYVLEKKPLELQYGPVTSTIIPYTEYQVKKLTNNVNYNSAAKTKEEEDFYIHANFKGNVLVNNRRQVTFAPGEVRSPFKIWRLARSWRVGYGEDGSIAQYTLDRNPKKDDRTHKPPVEFGVDDSRFLENGWIYDVVNGVRDWVDPPGFHQKRPSSWKLKGILDEFLVSVKDFPEFGFIYTFAIIEIRQNHYRVRMYEGVPVDLKEAQAIYKSTTPYKTENYPGVVLVGKDEGWIPIPDPKRLPVK